MIEKASFGKETWVKNKFRFTHEVLKLSHLNL
jgi:hypothetical protein